MYPPIRRIHASRRHPLREIPHGDRGSVSVWLALATIAMVVCVGIAVDLSGDVHAQQRATDIAAQAARAAGEQIAAAPAIRGNSPTIDPAPATRAAMTYLARAGVSGSVTIRAGNVVDVTVHDTYTPMFLSMIGISHLTVTGHSTAHLERAVQGVGR